jgi:hypothetical protein
LLRGEARWKWKHQSKWIWKEAKNVSISIERMGGLDRELIFQTQEKFLESIAMAFVGGFQQQEVCEE